MPREPKLQRWTDLIAALLRRHYVATFEELARDIPAYSDTSKKHDAVMRMFERDKDELRSFGIAIETVLFQDDDGEASGYKLDRKGFYMPYLSLAAREGRQGSQPMKPDKYGYRALASLVFEPDELVIISAAAQRVRSLGETILAEEAQSAIRKLSFDLPIPPPDEGAEPVVAMSRAMPSMSGMLAERWVDPGLSHQGEDVFELINDALERRKLVDFDYHTMSTDRNARRTVEAYGLFFLSSHWYLAGRDVDKAELRNFRLSRMRNLNVNSSRAQSADYEIPPGFNLRQHAKAKQSWELGDGDQNEAVVNFRGGTGASKAAARLGTNVEGSPDQRKFRFRRLDSFARWLLSFGGEAIPVSPEQLVTEFERQRRETHAVYGESR